jgi:GT2 family glycosyltransferase
MSSILSQAEGRRVAAVLVVGDGEAWLPAALTSLESQDYPHLDLVVVDNGSRDSSREIIESRVPVERTVTLRRGVGFGRAVAQVCDHEIVKAADHLLLVHDDLSLETDAVRLLVEALEADPSLAIVGPKLREWAAQPLLQEAGMTVDRFGRAENRVERGELDQGQADNRRDVLYVSTAGMLVRKTAFEELEGFDPRFPALRDDLDLCWRAWLLGHRVEVVPGSVGYHVAAGSRGARNLWRDRPWQARFLSERHALATLLKNYGLRRLLWVLPLTLLLGAAKLVGFAMTRRFTDLGATLRAYVWNLVKLPSTWRQRRVVQRNRRRGDAELDHLFATGLPRMRYYVEAMREWLAGSDTPALLSEQDPKPPEPEGSRLVRTARQRPAILVGAVLAVLYVAGAAALLGRGQLIGGTVLPWPEQPLEMLRSYASPISGGPLATDVSASPAQALLGLLDVVAFGNEWLAQRLLVLGLLPLAWLTSLRAGRLVTSTRGPRVVGATLYVLSPVVLGTLAQGRVGELVAAALFPALVLLTARVANPRSARKQAWRAAAWLALTTATIVAFAPGLWLIVAPVLLVGLAVSLRPDANAVARPLLRVLTASLGAVALLAPWLVDLAGSPAAVLDQAPASALPAWRALTLVPLTTSGVQGTAGYLAAAVTLAVMALALLLGLRLRPLPVTAMFAMLLTSGVVAWAASRSEIPWVWAPALLLPGAVAVAGLGVLAARTLRPALRAYAFGFRQLTVIVLMAPLLAGVGGAAWSVTTNPWVALDRDVELVPAYVAAETDRVGPYRVLLLDEDADGIRWGVAEATGPSMRTFGAAQSVRMSATLQQAVERIVSGDLDGARSLGLANVRYVMVAEDDPALAERLMAQPELEPSMAGAGRVFLVRSWVPRAVALPEDVAEQALDAGPAVDLRPYAEEGLAHHQGTFMGDVPEDGGVLMMSDEPGTWTARAGGRTLPPRPTPEHLAVTAYQLEDAEAGDTLALEPAGQPRRTAELALQGLVLFGLVSLLLRPPGFVERASSRVHAVPSAPPLLARDDVHEPPLEERLETVDSSSEGHR